MSIARKTILMVVAVTLVLFGTVYLSSNFFYLKGFQDLERKTIEQNVNQVVAALSVKLNALDAFCLDWAEWDDTYYFARVYNQEYITKNLMDATFIASDLSIFLVLDTKGDLVYGKAFDIPNARETTLPADLPNSLFSTVQTTSAEMESGVRGVTVFSGQPILIACRPLFTSLKEGPSTGYLVVGRYVDSAVISFLSGTTNLPTDKISIQFPGENAELDKAMVSLNNPDSIYVQIQKGDFISGYTQVKDLKGKPAFTISVTTSRDIVSEGRNSVAYLHTSLLVIAIIFCVLIVIIFRHLILGRMTALSNAVNAIGANGEISSRVQVEGKDELSRLADNINGMLESLEKSETRRQSQKEIIGHIITLTPHGILVINDEGYIVLINDTLRNLFDLENQNMMGVKVEDLPNMANIAGELNNFRLSHMTSLKKEIQQIIKGNNKVFIASFARLKEEDLYILYLTDITDERSKQESMYLTDRLASIGEMASGIAHELNNPLTSIIGLSEIIMRDEVPENVREDMELIKSESHRAAGIVRNLLSFARKNATIKQPVFINKIISDVLRLRSYEHGVNNIKIKNELDPTLPEIMVDNSQIQQVFINIILNAEYAMVQAHGKGTLKVKTELAGNMLKVIFADDGPGIEPEDLRHIFDPFFTTKEAGKGTGLGLSISYGIVAAHNGRIYATSEYGKGATFIVELPLHSAETNEQKPDAG